MTQRCAIEKGVYGLMVVETPVATAFDPVHVVDNVLVGLDVCHVAILNGRAAPAEELLLSTGEQAIGDICLETFTVMAP